MSTATTRSRPRRRDGHALGVYTVGEVATMCKVAPRTVVQWVDRHGLGGYRLPGAGRDRRIPAAELARFLSANGVPLPRELARAEGVLLVGFRSPPPGLAVPADAAHTAFDAGAMACGRHYRLIAVDATGLGRIEACQVAASAARLRPRPLLVAVWHGHLPGFDICTTAEAVAGFAATEGGAA